MFVLEYFLVPFTLSISHRRTHSLRHFCSLVAVKGTAPLGSLLTSKVCSQSSANENSGNCPVVWPGGGCLARATLPSSVTLPSHTNGSSSQALCAQACRTLLCFLKGLFPFSMKFLLVSATSPCLHPKMLRWAARASLTPIACPLLRDVLLQAQLQLCQSVVPTPKGA